MNIWKDWKRKWYERLKTWRSNLSKLLIFHVGYVCYLSLLHPVTWVEELAKKPSVWLKIHATTIPCTLEFYPHKISYQNSFLLFSRQGKDGRFTIYRLCSCLNRYSFVWWSKDKSNKPTKKKEILQKKIKQMNDCACMNILTQSYGLRYLTVSGIFSNSKRRPQNNAGHSWYLVLFYLRRIFFLQRSPRVVFQSRTPCYLESD